MELLDQWFSDSVSQNLRILGRYFKHACPCRFPRFVYWASKPHGRGTDPLQNMLVLTCRSYGESNIIQEVRRNDGGGGGWACPGCGTVWVDLCDEKSMLNYQHRFFASTLRAQPFVNQSVPAEVPQFSHSRRGEEWESFMLESVPA